MHASTSAQGTTSGNLRSLPPKQRADALRNLLRDRFGNKPGIVGFRKPAKARDPRASHFLLAALAAFLQLVSLAHPAHAGTLRIDVSLASYHTEQWARQSLNQRNPGLGIEYAINRDWSLAGGAYSNSYRRTTVYALAEWTPLHVGRRGHWHIDAGLAGGLASGYKRDEIPCAPLAGAAVIRIAAPSGFAMNLLGVPNAGSRQSGFIGFQLSVPLRAR